MFKDAKKGDKAYSYIRGWGKIVDIKSGSLPICVEFEDNKIEYFTVEGKKSIKDKHPTLFWGEVVFKAPKKPLPDLEVDTKVIVWHTSGTRYKMYFKKFDSRGNIVCFADGATSWSHSRTNTWGNWELAEDSSDEER